MDEKERKEKAEEERKLRLENIKMLLLLWLRSLKK